MHMFNVVTIMIRVDTFNYPSQMIDGGLCIIRSDGPRLAPYLGGSATTQGLVLAVPRFSWTLTEIKAQSGFERQKLPRTPKIVTVVSWPVMQI